MTQNLPPPISSLIPETAPFSEEQRIWLNGFFAGLVSLDGFGVTPLSGEQAAALISGATASKADDDDDGGALWHDQTLTMAERMKLADGQSLWLAHDGGDGATGLRPVRLRLQELFGRHRFRQGGAAEFVRAGRQGNHPHAQDAIRGIHEHSASKKAGGGGYRVRTSSAGGTRLFARQSR